MHSPLLTRRAFLGGLSLSTLALASIYRTIHPPRTPAASPVPAEDGDAIEIPPSPPPVRVVAADPDDAAAGAAARALRDFLAERLPDRPIQFGAGDEDAPRATVGAVAGSVGYPRQRVTQYLAPVTNWRLPLRYLEPAELIGVLSGRFADWSQVGCATPGAIERLDFGPAGAVAVPGVDRPIAPAARYDDYEALVRGLDEHPNGVALAPLGAIDFRVQALAIGDLDPLAGRGDLASYPLQRDLWLGWDAALGDGFREIVAEFAARQALALDGAPPGDPINVTVAGDIIFGRTVHSRMVRYGDWAHPLRAVAPRLGAADLTIADLECSISDNTEKPADPFTYLFTSNSAAVTGLDLAGVDGVSLANNHSMNFGKLGLTDTMTVLAQHGITHFGAGLNLAEARRPGIFEVKGAKIAFLGYDGITPDEYGARAARPGTCPLDADLLVEDIAAARAAGADLVIPFFHWSQEYVAVPSAAMRRIAHLAIDRGAGLVVGSHPHWVQGAEWYKGAPILYSLGNFVFDQDWSDETKQGMFTEIVLRAARPVRVRLVPVLIEDLNRPRTLDVVEGLPVLRRVYDATDAIAAMG